MRLVRLRIPEAIFDPAEIERGVSVARPRIAIERDGAFYDVEALERAFGEPLTTGGDPSDFATRVATLRCAGLYDLDSRVLRGERPTAARVPPGEGCVLAPIDTDRAAWISVDPSARVATLVQARALVGPDSFVGVASGATTVAEVHLGAVLGDDLRSATVAAARAAIMGYALAIVFTDAANDLASRARGAAAFGPALVSPYELPKLESRELEITAPRLVSPVRVRLGDRAASMVEAIAFASNDFELRSGDLVSVGPIASLEVALHERVTASVEGLDALTTTPTPRR